MTLSSQLLWNYWSIYHETWYVDRTSYGVMHIGRKLWSPHFCGSYAPWNLENIRKSTNNLSFLCQFFINEITASDAGPDIIRSHLLFIVVCSSPPTITNGFYELSNDTASYHCNPGYIPNQIKNIFQCNNSVWENVTFSCEGIQYSS